MARTAAQIQASIDALKAARGSGAKSISAGDRRVEYRDISEINSAIAADEQELAALGGLKTVREFRIRTHKGL